MHFSWVQCCSTCSILGEMFQVSSSRLGPQCFDVKLYERNDRTMLNAPLLKMLNYTRENAPVLKMLNYTREMVEQFWRHPCWKWCNDNWRNAFFGPTTWWLLVACPEHWAWRNLCDLAGLNAYFAYHIFPAGTWALTCDFSFNMKRWWNNTWVHQCLKRYDDKLYYSIK